MNGVVSEMLGWAASHEAIAIAQEVFGLTCQYLWCSRLIVDLAGERMELKPEALYVTTADRVVYAPLKTQIVCSGVYSSLVVPVGASSSGKDSLINALIGTTVLPPFGSMWAYHLSPRYTLTLSQYEHSFPVAQLPTGFDGTNPDHPSPRVFAALNCWRRAQLSKRRGALDTMKDRSMVDLLQRD